MDQKPNLPEQSRKAFERAYAAIPAITPTKETAWLIWKAALSAAPAQEPVAYIDPMKFAALRRFTDRGGVLTTITPHRAFPDDVPLYASPLQQEPQEGKALTDERIAEIAESVEAPTWGSFSLAFARGIERELRGAQEGNDD